MESLTKRRNKILKRLAEKEGGKSQVTIGNLREVVSVLEEMVVQERLETGLSEVMSYLWDSTDAKYSKELKKRKKSKKKK